MKKAIGQTVRDLKRGVNKKVLKVPSIEQKVLDATSNEPWGPHGSLLADVAQASRNYHEYQIIMSVLWRRINDTGKNWRHVYKSLTVLEYLVANGSERVIDDIREHSYQISTLSDFQYIDSGGRDQGNNVRKKSQSLVVLVNDKERIQEVRQKAASNRDKFRTTSAGMYRPGSGTSVGGYGDRYEDEGRYSNRDDEREGDRYGRDSEGQDVYRDDDYRGRSDNNDDYQRNADRDHTYEDDSQHSSRGSGGKADDHSQEGSATSKGIERKYSEQNISSPPTYEDAVSATDRSPTYNERDGESPVASAPKASSPTGASPSHASSSASAPAPASPAAPASAQDSNNEGDGFDEFDPRGSFTATPLGPTISNGSAPTASSSYAEMDLLGSLSESYSSNALALIPSNEQTMSPEAKATENFNSGPTFAPSSSASIDSNQPFGDPFGDGPFKADTNVSTDSFNPNPTQSIDTFGSDANYVQPPPTNPQFMQSEFSTPSQDFDILADILPPSSSFVDTQTGFHQMGFPPQTNQPADQSGSFPPQPGQPGGFPTQHGHPGGYPTQSGHPSGYPTQPGPPGSFPTQPGQSGGFPTQAGLPGGFPTQPGQSAGFQAQPGQHASYHHQPTEHQTGYMAPSFPIQASQPTSLTGNVFQASGQPNPPNSNSYGAYNSQNNFLSQPGLSIPVTSHQAPVSSAIVPLQQSNAKFETKSTVWADTLSRGLVNLNISGSKTNPLNDIGVDFDAINRKDKRMEKPTTAAVTSTITMGKAMGSGSGMGRAGAGALRPPPNTMMGPAGVNIGMTGGPGPGMSMGGYGASQPIGTGMGVNMNMGQNMGMGMNMGQNMGMGMGTNMNMGQGMGQSMGQGMGQGMGPSMGMGMGQSMGQGAGQGMGQGMPGGYNPMMGPGNYGQQPYNGGYR